MYIHPYYNFMGITWDADKSEHLRLSRGLGFEELTKTAYLALIKNPTRANQSYLLFEIDGYVWVVPCVVREDELFLKTAFRSRKYTRLWKSGELP